MRVRGHDLAVVLGVPAAFAVLAGVLGVAAPSAADVVRAGLVSASAAPDPDVVAAAVARDAATGDEAAGSETDMSGDTEGAPAQQGAPGSEGRVRVVSRIDVDEPVFFVTIDDGTFKTERALRVVERHRVPVTAFVTASAIGDDADYFRRITRFGGSVQNHTRNHEYLNRKKTDVAEAVCSIQDRYERLFGRRPWMLRPPGGFGFDDPSIQATVRSCGVGDVVMWNVVATEKSIQYVRGPLRRGDIVILHFNKELGAVLERVLEVGRRQGLRPAPLEDYLTARQARRAAGAPGAGAHSG